MVAAVDWLLEQNDEADQAEYMSRAGIITCMVKDVDTMKTNVQVPGVADRGRI